jgi:FkbM family methyltransferase
MAMRKHVNAVLQRVVAVPVVVRLRRRLGQRSRTAFYRPFVKPGDLVFDVGAHTGNRSSAFLALGARVVAVEPQPKCIAELRHSFGDDPRFTLVPSALGSTEGTQKMFISNATTLSSMSPEFIERTQASGRFSAYSIVEERPVETTTLDTLIAQHGVPNFCKVDVEGYEEQVLSGLSTAIPMVSLEFVPERLEATERCLDRLQELGDYQFNFGLLENPTLALPEWVDREALREGFARVDANTFGDVYARLASASR